MSRILVVDDSWLVQSGLAAALANEGYDTAVSPTGRDAWMTLYTDLPDLVVLDLALPGLDGLLFLRQLRRSELWQDLPVLACTGDDTEASIIQEVKELGVDGIVSRSMTVLLEQARRLVPANAQPAVARQLHASVA